MAGSSGRMALCLRWARQVVSKALVMSATDVSNDRHTGNWAWTIQRNKCNERRAVVDPKRTITITVTSLNVGCFCISILATVWLGIVLYCTQVLPTLTLPLSSTQYTSHPPTHFNILYVHIPSIHSFISSLIGCISIHSSLRLSLVICSPTLRCHKFTTLQFVSP